MKKIIVFLMVLLVIGYSAKSQILKPVKFAYSSKRVSPAEVIIYIKATINDGWHIYSTMQPDGGPNKTIFSFKSSKDFVLVGKLVEPKPIIKFEDVFNMKVMYFKKSVVFSQKIKLKSKQTVVKGKIEFMVCSDKECLPTDEVEFSIPVK